MGDASRNLPHDNKDLIAALGLFDGEGNINYARYNRNSPNGKVYKNEMLQKLYDNLDCIKNFRYCKTGTIHLKVKLKVLK